MKKVKKIDLGAYAFMFPGSLIYLSVIIFPVFYSFYISMFEWNGIGQMKFVGLENYVKLVTTDQVFPIAIKNNLIWIVLTVVFTTGVALIFAVLLNRPFHGRTFFRGFYYFPAVIAPIAVGITWRWVYEPNIGFINQFFKAIGVPFVQSWLSDPNTSLYATFIASMWQAIGQPMILFLAGLEAVPSDVLEASRIDGAGPFKQFFYVTVPLLKETFVIVLATQIVSAMKVFDIIQSLTGGGPNNSTEMMATYMYSQTFQYSNVGMGTAVACVMVLIMMIVIVPYVAFTARDD